jgi:carboxylesterase
VIVMGLSMGGTLALRLAEQHGDRVAGVVLVNASVHSEDRRLRYLPILKRISPSVRAIGNDIKRPGADELAYGRTPLRALDSLRDLWRLTVCDLGQVTQPVLLFRSAEDHVVEPSNAARILAGIGSTDVEERICANSHHVATLDYDDQAIFAASVAFSRRIAVTRTAG